MKPQGKVTIFMVVMIVMLSVYYFFMPKNEQQTQITTDPDTQQVAKSDEFAELRTQLADTREAMVVTLQGVLSGSEYSVDDKNLAIESIAEIQTLTLNEQQLETKIMNIGYNDAYVQAGDNSIEIQVYVDSLSLTEVNDIILLAKTQFGTDKLVSITYVPIVDPDTLN